MPIPIINNTPIVISFGVISFSPPLSSPVQTPGSSSSAYASAGQVPSDILSARTDRLYWHLTGHTSYRTSSVPDMLPTSF